MADAADMAEDTEAGMADAAGMAEDTADMAANRNTSLFESENQRYMSDAERRYYHNKNLPFGTEKL
jgi:hypothetical protein